VPEAGGCVSGAMIARRPPAVAEVGCDCGADPGQSCRDRDGHVRYIDHLSRTRAAVLVQVHGCSAVLSTEAHIAAQGNAI
jgi:hypothetical protein